MFRANMWQIRLQINLFWWEERLSFETWSSSFVHKSQRDGRVKSMKLLTKINEFAEQNQWNCRVKSLNLQNSALSSDILSNFFTWLFRNWDAENETLSLSEQSVNRVLPDNSIRWKTGNAARCWRERQSLVAKTPISVGENANRQSRWRHALKHSICYLFKSNVVVWQVLGFFLLSTEYRHLDRQFISRQKCVYVYNI